MNRGRPLGVDVLIPAADYNRSVIRLPVVAKPEFVQRRCSYLLVGQFPWNVFHTIWVYLPIIGNVQEKGGGVWSWDPTPFGCATVGHYDITRDSVSAVYNVNRVPIIRVYLHRYMFYTPRYLCSCFKFMNQIPILIFTRQLVAPRPLHFHIFHSTISARTPDRHSERERIKFDFVKIQSG